MIRKIKDQQLALQWVRDNIGDFGGDPDQVTLFGQSAGAMSVGLHSLSIPSSNGLFGSVIMQSNPFGIPYKTCSEAKTAAELLESNLECSEIECLRAASVEDILKQQTDTAIEMVSLLGLHLAGFLVWAPVIDGSFLVEEPTVSAAAGNLQVPTLMGTTHDEGVLFVNEISGAFGGKINAESYRTVLALIFGADHVPDIIALYGINESDNSEYLYRIATDYLFGCANRFVASQALSNLYIYEFDETSVNVWPNIVPCEGKACHGDDIPFTFHTAGQLGYHFTEEQDALSDAMMAYWGAFATHLNPNEDGLLLTWPAFAPSSMEYMILVTPERYITENPIPNCEFWDKIGYDLQPPSLAAAAALIAALGR